MSAYDQFLAETKTSAPTGSPKVVPPSIGDRSQPASPVSPARSAYDTFKAETSPVVSAPTPRATPVTPAPSTTITPQVEKPSLLGRGVTTILDWLNKNQKASSEAEFKMRELMGQGSKTKLTKDPITGKQTFSSENLDKYNTATPEEKLKIVAQSEADLPLMKLLNSPQAKSIYTSIGKGTSNLGQKFVARVKSLGDLTYEEAYQAELAKKNDPSNTLADNVYNGVLDSGAQSAVGILLGLSVSVLSRGRISPTVVSAPYFASISADAQLEEKGKIDSIGNIAIDTVGDTVLSKFAETALKSVIKEGGSSFLKNVFKSSAKGFGVEGSTEVAQSFLKYANDYKNAQTEEDKARIVQETKEYVKNGGMATEFLVGGIAGGIITGGATAIGQKINSDPNINVEDDKVDPKDPPTDPPSSAFARYQAETGRDLSKPAIELQKEMTPAKKEKSQVVEETNVKGEKNGDKKMVIQRVSRKGEDVIDVYIYAPDSSSAGTGGAPEGYVWSESMTKEKAEKKFQTSNEETLARRIVNPHDGYNYQTEKYDQEETATASLEGVDRENKTKLTYEESTPLADKATEIYWENKIKPEMESGKPVVIGADDLKDHFGRDYNDNNHPIYSQSAYKLFELALQKAKGNTLVLTAGGAGSGKTELVTKSLIRSGFNGIIYDSNLANYDGAVKQIDLARKAGKKIEIRGVLPNLEKSRTFTIQREKEVGRGISDATFARGHAGMPAVLAKLIEDGKVKESEVKLLDTRNLDGLDKAFEAIYKDEYVKNVLDTLTNLGYNESNLKETYAKTNFDQTTGQRTNGQVPDSEGSRATPPQDRTDKGETKRRGNGKEVPRTSEQRSTKQEEKVKPKEEKKKPTKKTRKTLHFVKGETTVLEKIVSSEGEILGTPVFTYKNDNGRYVVIDKKTGLSLSSNTYERLKTAIEKEKEYLVKKAGGETELKAMFEKGHSMALERFSDIFSATGQPSGSGFASIGRYREEGNVVAGRMDDIKPIEFPELLDLAKELSGNIPFVKKYTKANGMFYPRGTGEIGLNPDLFKEGNLQQLQKTFAHEIGHLIDYLPDQTMSRGNVLGRLAVLKGFSKDFYEGAGITRTNKEVRAELWELSKYWKPVDEATAPKSFLEYRKSAPEVYADFISVLFNDPRLAGEKAPASYNVFFEMLDKKPAVKQAYFELQDFLRYGDRVAKRRSATNQMFKLTEQLSRERQIQNQQEQEERERSVWFKFKTEFVDITEVVKEDVKRAEKEGKIINPDDNPTYYLEERNYLGGKIKSEVDTKFNNIYQDLQKEGLTWEDLGELMFYERILKGDRGEVANPLGYQPDFVQELMDTYQDVGTVKPDQEAHRKGTSDMKSTLGESRYIRLQELAVQYRQNLKSFFDQGREEGIYSEDLAKLFEQNAYYVPFKGAKYSGVSRTTFGVKQQKGTLGDIENPANTGIEKAVSIIRAIEKNRVTRKTIQFYQENFADEVIEAKRDAQGYPIPPREEGQSLVTYMEDGKVKGYYVDSYIAEALQKNTIAKQNQIIGAIRFFNSGLFRPLFITFNLGFQSFNLIRDFKRFWKNVPNMTILNAMKLYGKSVRASKIRAFGLPDNPSEADREAYDLINKLENDKVISITYNDIIKGENIEDAQIDRILRETGVREVKQTKLGAIGEKIGVTKETPIIKQAFQILDFIEKTGNMIETLPKVAGVFALEGKMNPIEMRSFVRKYVGSPDFLAGGRDKKSVNEILLFANAIAQGIRSDYTIATEPKSRGAYWWKTAQSELLPKALMLAVTAGLFGDWLKDLFDKVSEYDKANYTIIPLGEDENGKAIYFRMPSDETGRLIGGTFWKLATAIGSPEKLAELETYTDILTYAGGQVPSVSPVVQLGAFTIPSFIAGNNPYDFFRGRPILTDEQQLAGGSERLKPFLSYMFQQMGGNVFMKLNYNETVPKNPSLSEKIVSLPLASNIAGRFIKVSNYGETEKLRAITDDIKQENARENIANRRVVFDYVDQAQGKSYGEQQALKREMIKQIIENKIVTKEDRQKKSTLEKRFTTLLIRGEADPKVDLLVTAQTNEEKVALLMEYKRTMSDESFEDLRKFIIKNKVVSGEAYRQFIVNSKAK